MSELIATKRVDLLAPYLSLDQGPKIQAECESHRLSSASCPHPTAYGVADASKDAKKRLSRDSGQLRHQC